MSRTSGRPRHLACGAVLAWEQISGTLVKQADGYHGRCPSCGVRVVQVRRPTLGQKCHGKVLRELKPRKQCAKCPWKVGTDPNEIPNGYCERKHAALQSTIKSGLASIGNTLRMMACHETKAGKELPCVGWLANQLGPGNNIGLRMAVGAGRVSANFELDGEQHERLEDTLPQ
jgi:hypothetical protein